MGLGYRVDTGKMIEECFPSSIIKKKVCEGNTPLQEEGSLYTLSRHATVVEDFFKKNRELNSSMEDSLTKSIHGMSLSSDELLIGLVKRMAERVDYLEGRVRYLEGLNKGD